MNYIHLLCALLLLAMHQSGYAVFIGLTSLSNKENNQQVILLSDAHMTFMDPYIKRLVHHGLIDESTQKALNAGCDEQYTIAPRLVSYLLNDKNSKKCLITETVGGAFCDMARLGQIEARFGITSDVKDPEVLLCIPRLLLRQMQSLQEPLEMKSQVADAVKAKSSHTYLNHMNVLLREQFKWIAGDNRNEQEMLMGIAMPSVWPMFKELIEKNDPGLLADDAFQKLTIEYFKNDMINWAKTFKEKGIDDQSAHRAFAIVNDLLEKKELQETDHLVALYDYLSGKGLVQELQAVGKGSNDCCIKKFDVELQYYVQQHLMYASEQYKPEVTCIIAGASHTNYVQEYLSNYGFQTDYVVGVSEIKGSELENIPFLKQLPGKIERVNKAAQLLLNVE